MATRAPTPRVYPVGRDGAARRCEPNGAAQVQRAAIPVARVEHARDASSAAAGAGRMLDHGVMLGTVQSWAPFRSFGLAATFAVFGCGNDVSFDHHVAGVTTSGHGGGTSTSSSTTSGSQTSTSTGSASSSGAGGAPSSIDAGSPCGPCSKALPPWAAVDPSVLCPGSKAKALYDAIFKCACLGACAAPCATNCMGNGSNACDTCMVDEQAGCGKELAACENDM